MELVAPIFSPRIPLCLHCPVNTMCRAHEVGDTDRLPIKLKKKKLRIENYTVLVIQDENGHVAIEKRPDTGLLANMCQFPMINKAQADSGVIQKSLSEKN